MFSRFMTEQKYYVNFDIGRQLCDVRFLQFYEIMNINRATLVPFPHEYVCKLTKICAFIATHKGRTMMILLLKQSGDCLGKNSFMIDHVFWKWGGGGGGYSTNVYTGRLRPEVQPLIFFYTNHFSQKRFSFRIPPIEKWYPFHIPCLELCIILTAVNALPGGGTWVLFGWVCAAQDSKLAPRSKKKSPKIDTPF